ncbi:hypothetical protein KAR91_71900 [Candidatus Pacearchaeota archaeon]|nr:hypothetical protein [Candidatus Pacearchaeota archaeon]
MPTRTVTFGTATINDRDLGLMKIDTQIVSSITLFDRKNVAPPHNTWAEIGIMLGGKTESHIIASLYSGYLGTGHNLGWSGHYVAIGEHYIYALIHGPTVGLYRLTATLLKIVAREDNTFRVDP